MDEKEMRSQLLGVTATVAEYCQLLENCSEMEKDEFITATLLSLAKIYLEFSEIVPEESENDEELMSEYFSAGMGSYIDEDYYESIRRKIEMLLGSDDTFLETFEEDMKYSDTPIAASISESLADIFQPLYDFISAVKESEGENVIDAYRECRDNFISYWSQTLCNVLRALNHLKYQNV